MPEFRRAQFRMTADFSEDEVRSLPELIRFNATHNGTCTFSYHLNQNDGPPIETSFQGLYNAVENCISEIFNLLPGTQSARVEEGKLITAEPVAIFLESGLNLFVHIAALLWVGIPVVVLSARLSATGVRHLLNETGAQTVLTSQRLWSQESVSSTEASGEIKVQFARPCNFSPRDESDRIPLAPILENNCNAFISHSSGTTGLPKPIYHPQRYILGYAACHEFAVDEDVSGINVSTLPLYHGFGLLAPMLALSIGMPCCLPSPTSVPTAESTITLIKATSAKFLMTVPSILEDMAEDMAANASSLVALELVVAGGGPMKPEVAARLVNHGVNLLNHFGATELGALAPIFKPKSDYDWKYLRLRQDMGLQLLPVDSEDSDGIFKLVARPVGRDSVFTLQDRLKLREGSTRDIRLLGRNDDTIVLANGEKVMPQILESMLSGLLGVRTALLFGNTQFEVGVLIEPASSSLSDAEALTSYVWAKILEINPMLDAHARILDPGAVLILQGGRTIPRSDKGSVMRSEAYRVFEPEINSVYTRLEAAQSGELSAFDNSLDMADLETSLGKLSERFLRLPSGWDYRDNLFELGLDSLKATRLQRIITAQLARILPERRSLERLVYRLVYRYPSVKGMADRIRALMNGSADDPVVSDTDLMNQLVERFSSAICPSGAIRRGAVVLLTGSTGSIGCHLVAHLAQLDEVEQLICLNRPTTEVDEIVSMDTFARQKRAFAQHAVYMPEAAWSKITAITAETRKTNAGLDRHTYQQLSRSVTHIVHNAWPMDFNRPLSSFEAHFQSLKSLLNLALDICSATTRCTRFVFHSSIAVTANYVKVTGKAGPIPEAPIADPAIPSEMGYAQAKWICEKIIEQVAQKYADELNCSIIRIGQIVGSTSHGVWNASEHVPALLKTAHSLRQLPSIEGTVSWLPVNVAAAVISDIVLHAGAGQLVYHIENPHRQSWKDILDIFRDALSLGGEVDKVIPFDNWLQLACEARNVESPSTCYPAVELLDFLQTDFQHLGVGKIVLDMQESRKISQTLERTLPAGEGLIRLCVEYWRSIGFLDTHQE
ncbi:hypothetical protein F4677DRAFT_462219 [Hypoxylon crocopeplum]|nr:hypothetical protein F4677DRAFT_462219 [Hypoxylon crocopeplum]